MALQIVRDPVDGFRHGTRLRSFSTASDRRGLRSLGPGEHLGHERVEIAAWKERARQSERLPGLDVPSLISDYEASIELHRPVLDEIVQHTGCGLAPIMLSDVAGDRSLRMVWTEADVIDPRAVTGELGTHPAVQPVHVGVSEEAARDAGLVGEDEYPIAGLVEAANGPRNVGHPADAVLRADIAIVTVDDAIAIEECGGFRRAAVRHFQVPASSQARLSRSRPRSAPRYLACSGGRSSCRSCSGRVGRRARSCPAPRSRRGR